MSYSHTVIDGGEDVEREGDPSFDEMLADLQEQIDILAEGGGSTPSGTGFVRVVSGVIQDPAQPLSAADIPNLDTAKITTGQFVDARMPTASNAATIGAISTVANAALPKAGYPSGSAAMTGPLAFTGTQSNAGAGITNAYRNANGTLILNVPTGESLAVTENGSTAKGVSLLPSNGAVFYGTQTSYGASIASIYRDSGGNLNSNVATGATHIARVNGTRVGGFPLVPGDMPALQYARLTRTTDQTGNTGTYAVNVIAYNNVATNEGTLISNSSGAVTLNKTGTYFLRANCRFASTSSDATLVPYLNGTTTRIFPAAYVPAVASAPKIPHICGIFRATAGDVIRVAGAGGTVGNFEATEGGMELELWLLKEG